MIKVWVSQGLDASEEGGGQAPARKIKVNSKQTERMHLKFQSVSSNVQWNFPVRTYVSYLVHLLFQNKEIFCSALTTPAGDLME